MLLSFVECINLQPIYENGKPIVEKYRRGLLIVVAPKNAVDLKSDIFKKGIIFQVDLHGLKVSIEFRLQTPSSVP